MCMAVCSLTAHFLFVCGSLSCALSPDKSRPGSAGAGIPPVERSCLCWRRRLQGLVIEGLVIEGLVIPYAPTQHARTTHTARTHIYTLYTLGISM